MIDVTETPYRMTPPREDAIPITRIAAEGIATNGTVVCKMITTARDLPDAVFQHDIKYLAWIVQHDASDQGLTIDVDTIKVEWWNDWLNPPEDDE